MARKGRLRPVQKEHKLKYSNLGPSAVESQISSSMMMTDGIASQTESVSQAFDHDKDEKPDHAAMQSMLQSMRGSGIIVGGG